MIKVEKNIHGFWSVRDKPNQEVLSEYYRDKYYQELSGNYQSKYSDDEIKYFLNKIDQSYYAIKKIKSDCKSFLEIGCGEGFAMKFFRQKGLAVKGIDFSSAGLRNCNPDVEDALVTGDVFSLLQSEIRGKKRYDIVWMQNVLEHVIDPIELLNSLKSIVSKDGILVIRIPNDFSNIQTELLRLGKIESEYWIKVPDHLSYFDQNSIRNVLTHVGWDCFEILGDFPIDWFLFNSFSNYIAEPEKGKSAHLARVQLENILADQPVSKLIQFFSSAAELGIGRDLTCFSRLRKMDE